MKCLGTYYRYVLLGLFLFIPYLSVWAVDITSSINVNRGRPYYDYQNSQTYTNVSLTNTSAETITPPLRLVIDNITTSAVTVANADGVLADGRPYFDYSGALGDGLLGPSETSAGIELRFDNPNRLRFNFTTVVLGEIQVSNTPPTADAGPDQTAYVGDVITLDGSGSSDVDGDALSFLWALAAVPAGSTASVSDPTAVQPSFNVDLPGNYVAQLIVSDGTADSVPDTVVITTENSAPVADAGPDQTAYVGDVTTLDGSGSSDVDGDALSFLWALTAVPAGSAAIVSDPTAVQPTFVIDVPGTYIAQLIVNDGTLDSSPDTVTITTLNNAPVADAGPNQSGYVGDLITLDGSGSSDVDGDPLTFLWALTAVPAGSAASVSDPTAVQPSFNVDLPGTYIAQLIVNDGDLDSTPDNVVITAAVYIPPDRDNDGLTDDDENALGTDPDNPDTDGDGLSDGDEVNEYATNPLLSDTDEDGCDDQKEITLGSNPNLAGDCGIPGELPVTGRAPLDFKGNEFLLAFTQNSDLISGTSYGWHNELYLTAETVTLVTIEYPAFNATPIFTKTVAVNPDTFTKVALPESVANGWSRNQIQNNTLRAYGPDDFTVYQANRSGHSSDVALALPIDGMNTEYIVADYDTFGYFRGDTVPTQYTVYAAFDNTTVNVVPPSSAQDPDPFTIQLNRGEGYHIESLTGLSGTVIKADHPIGLVNGNLCAQVLRSEAACDVLFEVAVPVHAWGKRVPVANFPFRAGSTYRIFAADNNTTITLDGKVLGTINKGQFIQTPILAGNHYITAGKSVLVTQYMTGGLFPGSTLGDPAMVNITPVSQYRQSHIFTTIGSDQFIVHYASIIAENQDIDAILLDGQAIGAAAFTAIPGSGFSAAVIPVTPGTHTTSSPGVHTVMVEGYGSFDSYSYPVAGQSEFVNSRGDNEPPLCNDLTESGVDSYFVGSAVDDRDGEDANGNRFLDPNEDINGNGLIDGDQGILSIRLLEHAANLRLTVDPFVPGDRTVNYRVDLIDPDVDGRGVVEVMDGNGNFCPQQIALTAANRRNADLTVMPETVGTSSAAAQAAIRGAGLNVGALTSLFSATVPIGDVISQQPVGGTSIAEGEAINIVISGGAIMTAVPDVIGITQGEGVNAIGSASLVVGSIVKETSAVYPADHIISQNPPAGATVAQGTPVDLTLSIGTNGSDIIAVPNVTSIPQADAEQVINLAKLKVGHIFTTTSDKLPFPFTVEGCPDINDCYSIPAGYIITQYPPAGTAVHEGDTVDLIVSAGASLTVVPDVVGMQRDKAIDEIHGLARLTTGVITGEYSELVPYGQVISQNPAGGETVAEGSPVDLVVSIGAAITPIPDVINQSQADAATAITAAGLTIGTLTSEYHPSVPSGHVISQDPPCGITESAASVNLTVSLGPATVAVPDVTFRSHSYAIGTIRSVALPVGNVTGIHDETTFAGIVISQNPAPGTVVTGEPVDIVVSLGPAIRPVPDTIGLQEAEALAAISAAGFTQQSVFYANSITIPAGEVVNQSPQGDTNAAESSTFIILVSIGPPVSGFVPALIGLSQSEADAMISAAGMTTGTVTLENDPYAPAGLIIDQSLDEGLPVSAGTPLDLVVSLGPGPTSYVSVPDIEGITETSAVTAINAHGLTRGTVYYEISHTASPGQILRQYPMSGTSVAIKSSVDIIVAADPCDWGPTRTAITVPDVSNQQRESAIATIQAVGLRSGIITTEYNSSIPQGRVINQFPAAGTEVFNSSAVDLIVSSGQLKPVPDVVGLTQTAAETAINNAGLYVGSGFRSTASSSTTVAAGHIIAQYPAAGVLVRDNSSVDLVVSLGPGPDQGMVTVPDLRGIGSAGIEDFKLRPLGLSLGTLTRQRSAITSGLIIGQFPLPGSMVPAGTAINITVSSGIFFNDPYANLYVPNLIGLSLDEAKATIASYKFTMGDINAREDTYVPAGYVITQSPSPGTYAAEGDPVGVLISLGKGPFGTVAVPDIFGMNESDAIAAITGINLTVGTVSNAYSANPIGTVITQSPQGGFDVSIGTPVNFVLSRGPVPSVDPTDVFVPDVVGTQEGYARLTVLQAGLSIGIGTRYEFNDSVPAGTILSQNPVGGQLVNKGSAVDLVISRGADTINPQITIYSTPTIFDVGEQGTINVQVSDDTEIAEIIVTVGGDPLNLSPPLTSNMGFYQGIATYTPTVAGFYEVRATATDSSGNTGVTTMVIVVRDSSDVDPPFVSITSPGDSAELSTLTGVIGTVTDPQLISYQLLLAPAGSEEYQVITSGTSAIIDGQLGSIDPTLLANGFYDLKLTAVDINGLTSSIEQPVYVTGENKPGEFSITFTDLVTPLAGIPIAIQRTYNSLDRGTSHDFGHGWSLDIVQQATYEYNRKPGDGWEVTAGTGGLTSPCDVATESKTHITEIAFSPREFYTFALNVQMYGIPSVISGGCAGTVSFDQIGGLPGATLDIVGDNTVVWLSGSDQLYRPGFLNEPYEPPLVRLTTLDGRQYEFSRSVLTLMTDANGNSLTINTDSIVHSSGRSITFTRDGQGRITRITDARGQSMDYTYDSEGNLITFTNRAANSTTFTYDSNHLLLDIQDPTGHIPLRNIYDNRGRLVAQMDAAGNIMELVHDIANRIETVKDRLGNITIYEYDAEGNITSKTDPLGNVSTYTYDERGNMLTETDPLGRTAIKTYDDQNNILSETDFEGNTTEYVYNTRGDVISITEANGNVTTNIYDDRGNRLQRQDAEGHITQFSYDGDGNMLSKTDPLGNVTQYTYDSSGNQTSITDPFGNVTNMTYDDNGNMLTKNRTRTLPDGSVENMTALFEYNSLDNLIRTVDPLGNGFTITDDALGIPETFTDTKGNTTRYVFDELRNPVRIIYPDGSEENFSYDAEGRILSETSRDGNTTRYEYDPLGRLIRKINPDGTAVSTTYDAVGRVLTRTDERDNVTTYRYLTQLIEITDPLGNVTVQEYDNDGPPAQVGNEGNIIRTTDARGNITTFIYDRSDDMHGRGRLSGITFPDGSTINYTYNANGKRIAETDQAGNTTRFQYDALGRLTRVIDPVGNATSYDYDEKGNRTRITDANGNTTRFEYDALGRVTRQILPLGQGATFEYDANGNLITRTDFNGDVIMYDYDANSRLVNKLLPYAVGFSYTPEGRRTKAGGDSYTYDSMGRLITENKSNFVTVAYAYDAAGNRTLVTTPQGITRYTHDALNRISTVTDSDGGVTRYNYDATGNIKSVITPNGITTSYTYDTLNRISHVETTDTSGSTLESYDYTRGPAGNILQVTEGHSGRTIEYSYDAAYRLTTETINDPVSGTRSITYTYDAVGNRLSKNDSSVGLTTYTYDANDRLITENGPVGLINYSYDANGNMTGKSGPGFNLIYSYDIEGRLIGVDDGFNLIGYEYDTEGYRTRTLNNGNLVTDFLVDKNRQFPQVLRETGPGGSEQASYVYGRDLIRIKQPLAGTRYYHYDAQMSARHLTDASGITSDAYSYDAFGNLSDVSGTTVNNYRYSGEQYDPYSGLYYLRARYYDPAIGRFISRDPFEGSVLDPMSQHKYLYTANNPVNKRDPSGLFSLGGLSISLNVGSILAVNVAPKLSSGIQIIHGFHIAFTRRVAGIQQAGGWKAYRYERWYGEPTPARENVVSQTWRNVYLATFKDIKFEEHALCPSNWVAYVSEPYEKLEINICPKFWELPFLGASSSSGYASQVGSVIHELTHIRSIGDTDDIVEIDGKEYQIYGPLYTAALAMGYPEHAVYIADNYTMQIESLWGSGF